MLGKIRPPGAPSADRAQARAAPLISRRGLLALALFGLPLAAFAVAGALAMWRQGWLLYTWWILPAAWGAAYLAVRSRAGAREEAPAPPPLHWTARDREAWALVEKHREHVAEIPAERLMDPRFYFETAMDLSLEIARHYHPKASDPVGSLTVAEIITAANLAFADLDQKVETYVPGGHLVTMNQWRAIARSPRWIKAIGNVSWAVSSVVQPANVLRYLSSRATVSPLLRYFRENAFASFYGYFVGEVGHYAIELNSGRLRGGTERYRAALAELRHDPRFPGGAEAFGRPADAGPGFAARAPAAEPEEGALPTPRAVTVALIGQVGAGKSSLIRCLLKERISIPDVLPRTKRVERHELSIAGSQHRLAFFDTPGYGAPKPARSDLRDIRRACRDADLVLLVLSARSADREEDARLLARMRAWTDDPRRKPPPVLAVLTHVDELEPAGEWAPPYELEDASSPKARSIRAVLERVHAQLDGGIAGVVPVCTDVARGRAYGVEEWLLPVIAALLDEARACSVLRSLHAELGARNVPRVLSQLRHAGAALLRSVV